MMSRREFGGEVGGMFVGGSLLVAQGRGGSGPGPAADPVGDHILREAIRGAKAVQAGTPSAETFNALAANFRLHAAHAKALDLDGRVKRIVGRQIDRRGRAAVVDDAIEHEHGDHHERLHALDLDGLDVGSHDLSRSQYEQGLSALLVSGLTPALEEATSVLERAARSIARLTTPNGAVRVQLPCFQTRASCEFMKVLTAIICVAATAGGQIELLPVCAVLTVETATICFIAWAEGC